MLEPAKLAILPAMATAIILAILGSAKVAKAIHDFASDEAKSLAKDVAGTGIKSLIHRLQPTDREKAAKQAVRNFAEAWYQELEGTVALSAALPGYKDQLEDLLAAAAPEISGWMDPDIKEIDLGPVERIWYGIKKADLPPDFDWSLVARNYARAIKKQFREDPSIRGAYETAPQERTAEASERIAVATERIAGPLREFDLEAYRTFLREKKCNTLQLATMHFSSYSIESKGLAVERICPTIRSGIGPSPGITTRNSAEDARGRAFDRAGGGKRGSGPAKTISIQPDPSNPRYPRS